MCCRVIKNRSYQKKKNLREKSYHYFIRHIRKKKKSYEKLIEGSIVLNFETLMVHFGLREMEGE